jgi:hypothetical protein
MRFCALALLLCACGDDSSTGGGPQNKPVLGVGSFAGSFDDGAAGTLHGLLGAVADSDGRFSLTFQREELPFFEGNVAGMLFEGQNMYHPIVAYNAQGVLTDAEIDVTSGTVHATVKTYRQQGNPNPDRTITIDGTLGMMGGSGTFTAMTSAGTTSGTWQLAPGIPLDAGRPMPPDAPVDAPIVDAPADAPELDAGVD